MMSFYNVLRIKHTVLSAERRKQMYIFYLYCFAIVPLTQKHQFPASHVNEQTIFQYQVI